MIKTILQIKYRKRRSNEILHRFNNIFFKYESELLSRIHHVGRQTIDHRTQIRRQNVDQHITQTKASKDQRLTKETSAIFFLHYIVKIINLLISFFQIAIPIAEYTIVFFLVF